MPPEGTRRGKFSQFVSYHVLGDIHRDELPAVVDGDGLPHEIRGDHRGPGPGLDYGLLAGIHVLLNLLIQAVMNVWSFF